MGDIEDATAALADATLIGDTPQQEQLGEAVAAHLSNRTPPRSEPAKLVDMTDDLLRAVEEQQ